MWFPEISLFFIFSNNIIFVFCEKNELGDVALTILTKNWLHGNPVFIIGKSQ